MRDFLWDAGVIPGHELMRPVFMLVALAVLGVGVASANTPPLADAGLDQQVEENSTVYLDAGGSVDPDGHIDSYEWSITAPDGTELEPDCETCEQTEFVPEQTGQYNVTVEVTDDDGATREDTLHVDVEASTPPSVTVSGPDAVIAGKTLTYTADASAGSDNLSTVSWRVDGSHRAHVEASGDAETATREFSFEDGEHTVTAVVIDNSGKRESDEMTVEAVEPVGTTVVDDGGGGGSGGGGNDVKGGQRGKRSDGNPDGLIEYDTNTGEWRVDQDSAERGDGSVRIGDTEISLDKLSRVESSEDFTQTLKDVGISERDALETATAETGQPIKDTVTIEQYDPHTKNPNSGQETSENWLNEHSGDGGDDPTGGHNPTTRISLVTSGSSGSGGGGSGGGGSGGGGGGSGGSGGGGGGGGVWVGL